MFDFGRFFFNLLRKILFLWVRTEASSHDARNLALDPEKPVVYVLQHSALSSKLVLEEEVQRAGLPSSQQPLTIADQVLSKSHLFLISEKGQFFRRRFSPIIQNRLKKLVQAAKVDDELDVQIVPVSIYWGRSPDKEKSLFKLMMANSWTVAGRIRQFFLILIHGRNTMIQFSAPLSLRQIVSDSTTADIASRKLARVLRVHFRRIRQATLGPDLSHRRTLVSRLIRSQAVKDAIEDTVRKEKTTTAKASKKALKYADEIASNMSIATIRFLEIFLSWVWNKIYKGIKVNNVEAVREAAQQGAVIYVPCHRSHIDYLLLSYVLFRNGLATPHIAAGINLNMPVVGAILRRGGAFFMRRSFKNNKLYATVFNEYMHSIFTKGYPVEYFVEGGRSRTGRTLQPKAGMLLMTVRSFLRDSRKPIIFVPVYVGYEKILEARSYLGELKGKKKEKENIFTLFKTVKKLRSSFGQVSLNFGTPFLLKDTLDRLQPGWDQQTYEADARPAWLPNAISELSEQVAIGINNAAAINPVNIVAALLLSTPRQSMDAHVLADHCDAVINLLQQNRYSDTVTFPAGRGIDWIGYTEKMNFALRQKQALGDIISLVGTNAILLTYYRNNILHLLAVPALVASMLQNNSRMSVEKLVWLSKAVYPYIKSELFIRWDKSEIESVIHAWIATLTDNGLLIREKSAVHRPLAGSREAVLLDALARMILPTLERYYIAIAILRKNGPGKITANELESQSTLMAERMSILYGLNAPEFFDKTLFRNFINLLRQDGYIQTNDQGHLIYDESLEQVAEDARLVLNAELRLSILQVTNQTEANPTKTFRKAS